MSAGRLRRGIGLVLLCGLVGSGAEAGRIVALAPSVVETLFAVGAGAEVVGVTELSDFPPEARRIERVGSYMQPNVEAVIARRPDLVIAVPSPGNREAVEALMSLGFRVVVVAEGPTVGEVCDSILRIADEAGRAAEGREVVRRLRERIDGVRRRVAPFPRRRVLMVVGESPLVVVGDGNLLDELLRDSGADNVASGLGPWPRLSIEFVIKSAPQVIVDSSMGDEATADLSFYADLDLEAVRSRRIHAVRLDEVLRPGPRLGDGLEKLARLIHPEAFDGPPPGDAEAALRR
jgi:iron complex transport system substrate-binding protein